MLQNLQKDIDTTYAPLTLMHLGELCMFQYTSCHLMLIDDLLLQKINSGQKTIEISGALERNTFHESIKQGDFLVFIEKNRVIQTIAQVGEVKTLGTAMGSKDVMLLLLDEMLPVAPQKLVGEEEIGSMITLCTKINEHNWGLLTQERQKELLDFLQYTPYEDPSFLIMDHGFFDMNGRVVILDEELLLEKQEKLISIPKNLSIAFYYGCIPALKVSECHHLEKIEELYANPNGIEISRCNGFTTIGSNVHAGYSIELEHLPQLQYLSEDLVIKNYGEESVLSIIDAPRLTELPPLYGVDAGFYFEQCGSLQGLPKDFAKGKVQGSFSLIDCAQFSSLPEKLWVKGMFHLKNCPLLTALPEEFVVGKSLHIKGNIGIKKLPEGMHINGDLVLLLETPCELPTTISVGGDVTVHAVFLPQEHLLHEWKKQGMVQGEIKIM